MTGMETTRMNRLIAVTAALRALLLTLLLGVIPALCPANAADAPANRLEAIDVQPLTGQRLELEFKLSGPAPQPLAFTIDNPARISLDLPGTALALASRRVDVRKAGLDSIVAAEGAGRTRVVLNLDRLVPYATRTQGNSLFVTLGEAPAVAAAAPAVSAAAAQPGRAAVAAIGRGIRSLDFRRGADGAGRIVVKLADPHTPINVRQQGNQIVVDFAGTDLPQNYMRRYDVTDWGTPVESFDAVRANGGARLLINATGEFEQLAYQSDDQYVIEVQPPRAARVQAEQDKPVYVGEKLTLNFQDIEIRSVLQLLADAGGFNIVVTDSVTGGVTLRLQNVPWDQALDIVLRTKGLDKRRQDNVIIVAPAEELATREKAALASRRDMQDLAPLRTEYLQINYAKASDIAALVLATAGKGGGGGKNSMLSERGTVSVDDRTNTLLIQDTSDSIANVRQLVNTLDIPVRQVLIEARIVVVSDQFSRDLGARAGLTATRNNGSNGLYSTSGTASSTDTMLSSALTNLKTSNSPYPVSVPVAGGAANRYNVNLPVANPAGSLAMMVLGSDYIVDLELSAAQTEGRGEVISSPRVITANQKEAIIEQGTEIPYQQSASSGAATIQFKKAVLSLRVTPLITPDNRVVLDLNVKKDSVGQVIVTSGGVNVPSIDTSEISNQVIVADGQTVVLGGILQTERRTSETKVPLLGDVPVLGNLFKRNSKTNNKAELLIFITPKILREGVNVY